MVRSFSLGKLAYNKKKIANADTQIRGAYQENNIYNKQPGKNTINLTKNDLEQPSRLGKETKYTNQTREHLEHPPRIGIKTATPYA